MKNVLLVTVLGATALLAACGDGPVQAESVIKGYVVVDAPIIRANDACYLRVRPYNENVAPTRLMRFRKPADNSVVASLVTRYTVCTLSKPGDLIQERTVE